jgi:RNA polymerase sigma factor (sigma-70 family)
MQASRVGATSSELEDAYRALWPRLARLGHLLTGSVQLGEEIAQEAFVGLLKQEGRVEHPEAYLRRSIANLAVNRHRRSALEQRYLAAQRLEPQLPPEVDDMWAALSRLPSRQRAVLVLRFYEDLSESDIGRVLGCRPGTVKSLASRILTGFIAAAVVATAGIGTAAATGHWSAHASYFSDDAPGDHVLQGRLVGSEAGPHGSRLELWLGSTAKGYTCVSEFLKASPTWQPPQGLRAGWTGGECLNHLTPATTTFGYYGSNGPTPSRYFLYAFTAGDATSARLDLPDGTTRPAFVGGGWVGGWVPSSKHDGIATLVGYDAQGNQVGQDRFSLRTAENQ